MSDTPPRAAGQAVASAPGRFVLALLRISVGFVFLWAFLDKAFGLGFPTPSRRAWIHGGEPAQGYLRGALDATKPFTPFFQSLATPLADWLFMSGLLFVGAATVLGVASRLAALAGVVMMVMMYLAEGTFVVGSANPVVDSHLVYALVLVLVALLGAGDTLGLGKWWKRLGPVKRVPLLV